MENIAHSAAVVFSDRRNCFEPSESIAKGTASSTMELLAVILPFLRYALGENTFRYLLGMIYTHLNVTQASLAEISGVCEKTIRKGAGEYQAQILPDRLRQRKPGGGRKRIDALIPSVVKKIRNIINVEVYGSCIGKAKLFTSMSLRKIQAGLSKANIHIAISTIREVLKRLKISKKKNRKLYCGNCKTITQEEKDLQNRQFEFIGQVMKKTEEEGNPALSIDCKKKEVLGLLAYAGSCYTDQKNPIAVLDHDFVKPLQIKTLKHMKDLLHRQEGKAIPFGIYDIFRNAGYVNVGITHDTPAFSVSSLEKFIPEIRKAYPSMKKIVLFCDGGGSNGTHCHQFRYELAKLADRIGVPIEVNHYPPYKSKYNKIEHRLFSEISKSFAGLPLLDLDTVLNRISAVRTTTGLTCKAELDTHYYATKEKASKEQLDSASIEYIGPTAERGHWSYIIYGTKDRNGLNEAERPTVFDVQKEMAAGKIPDVDNGTLTYIPKKKPGRPRKAS